MPVHLRLSIILSAAIIVGAVNQRYLTSRLAVDKFVATRRAIPVGGSLSVSDLRPIELGGDLASLGDLLVPWDERMLVVETPILRGRKSGELLTRRDVEQGAFAPYLASADETTFTVDLPKELGLTRRYNIGSRFCVVLSRTDPETNESTVEQIGPFTIRQIGSLSTRIDQSLLNKVAGSDVTLSVPAVPGDALPRDARLLLDAVQHQRGLRVYSLCDPPAR